MNSLFFKRSEKQEQASNLIKTLFDWIVQSQKNLLNSKHLCNNSACILINLSTNYLHSSMSKIQTTEQPGGSVNLTEVQNRCMQKIKTEAGSSWLLGLRKKKWLAFSTTEGAG